MSRWRTGAWTIVAAIAVLWPSRFIGPLDGVPFDQPSDALLLGLAVEKFWVLCLNVRGRLLKRVEITSGAATSTLAPVGGDTNA